LAPLLLLDPNFVDLAIERKGPSVEVIEGDGGAEINAHVQAFASGESAGHSSLNGCAGNLLAVHC